MLLTAELQFSEFISYVKNNQGSLTWIWIINKLLDNPEMLLFLLKGYQPYGEWKGAPLHEDRKRPPILVNKRPPYSSLLRPCNSYQTNQERFSDDERLDDFPRLPPDSLSTSFQITPHIGMVLISIDADRFVGYLLQLVWRYHKKKDILKRLLRLILEALIRGTVVIVTSIWVLM